MESGTEQKNAVETNAGLTKLLIKKYEKDPSLAGAVAALQEADVHATKLMDERATATGVVAGLLGSATLGATLFSAALSGSPHSEQNLVITLAGVLITTGSAVATHLSLGQRAQNILSEANERFHIVTTNK